MRHSSAARKVVQLQLEGQSGGRSVRVAVWSNESPSLLNILQNSFVRLVGLKGRLTPEGTLELHGDEGTLVEVLSAPKQIGEAGSGRFRVLSIGRLRRRGEGNVSASLLVVDGSGVFYTLILRGKATDLIGGLKSDVIIECKFRETGISTIICDSETDVKMLAEDDPSLLNLQGLFCKIRDIRESPSPLLLEVIALSKTSSQSIVTKKGETVEKAEVLIGDETKEIKLVAWRDLAEEIQGIVPGERLRLIGVVPSKGLNGTATLQLKSYSQVERIS